MARPDIRRITEMHSPNAQPLSAKVGTAEFSGQGVRRLGNGALSGLAKAEALTGAMYPAQDGEYAYLRAPPVPEPLGHAWMIDRLPSSA